MRKYILFLLIFVCSQAIFAIGDDYSISEIYVELDIGYETYFAEISGTSISSILRPEFGQVKKLYKKGRLSDIGYGKYAVKLKWVTDDIFAIEGTSFLLKIMFASQFTFNYGDWILDTTYGINGRIVKRQ